ncbi:Pentatricopeptide repeat-containing protein [Cynara cardunculus var. scolymus]|uniref:Pentatricopeptide repeat-containing protein n=1 Tax=Cynara cardunculus var. scolymus TaxID=59895 RepID=A0A103Y2Q4_CYNCS|nr:Pentatricopeptide repeat-containing protein [Cynara cardunculus var. scolymus]
MILSKLPKSKRFSTLISSSSSRRNHLSSLSVANLLKAGFNPTLRNYNNFLVQLFKTKKIRFITDFISQLHSNQIEGDCITHSVFTRALLKQHNYERAVEFINTQIGKTPNILQNRILDALIQGLCVNAQDPERGFLVLQDYLNIDGIFPSSFTFCALISSFSRQGKMDRAIEVLEVMADEKFKYPFDNFVFSSVISGFVNIGKPELAVGFYENAAKSAALQMNIVTYTCLLSAYCRLERFEEVSDLVSRIEKDGLTFDVVFYGSIVYEIRDFDGVFRLLDEMKEHGVHPSVVTYNTIINGLCKSGRTAEAYEISIGIRGDVVTYSTLLHGYIREKDSMGLLMTKRRLEEAGVSMDVVMCNVLIKALFLVGSFEDAYVIYKGMVEMGLTANHATYYTLIDGYCKCGRIEEALEIFDELRRTSLTSVESYNCIINGLCKQNMIDMAIQVFIELHGRGMPLDLGIYRNLLQSILRATGPDGILNFIQKIEKLEPEVFHTLCNNALCFLCDGGFSEYASDLYTFMRRNGFVLTTISYYSLVELLLKDPKMRFPEICLSDFVKEIGIFEPRVSKIILHYLCMKDVSLAVKFLKSRNSKTQSLTFPVSILKTLIKNGRAEDAFKLLMGAKERLPFMDVVDYTIVVDGLCKEGHIGKALDVCTLAKNYGITLNTITYNSVIYGLCHQGCFVKAFRLFDSLEKIDVIPSEITYATLIDALCKEGYLLDAEKLLERMIMQGLKPNIRVHNSLINGYSKLGRLPEVLKLVADLDEKGVKADEFTASTVIKCFCRNGNMEGALDYYFDSRMKGLLPDLLGFFYLIRGLCSKGRMEESRSILRDMLQTETIVKLLKKVDTGAETESVDHFLVSLCDQGSIQEAVMILDEIVHMFFPLGKKVDNGEFRVAVFEPLILGHEDDVVHDDFEAYYDLLASLCSKGELKKANRIAKLLAGFDGG